MRLQIHLDDDEIVGRRRFLLSLSDDADVGQLRSLIKARLQGISALDDRPLVLQTVDGYQIDVHDADRVHDLIPADSVVVVRFDATAPDSQLIALLDSSAADDATLRGLIGLAVLAPSADIADRALSRLCRSVGDAARCDQLGAFLVHETARRGRLALLLDLRPDLAPRLLSPALIAAAVLDQQPGAADAPPPPPLLVLCRAAGVPAAATVRDTVRSLARVSDLRPHLSRLVRDDLAWLAAPAARAAGWSAPAIDALTEVQFDRVLHGMMLADARGPFRAFAKAAIETRFGPRMAGDADLIAVLYGLVRDGRATWAARLLGLLARHCRTKPLSAAIADLSRIEQDPILRIHLT